MYSADRLSTLRLCCFVGKILYKKKKYELDVTLSWLLQIKSLLRVCYFTISCFQESLLKLLLADLKEVHYINETLFVNPTCLPLSHNNWAVFQFKCQSETFNRILKVIPISEIPRGRILCSSDTFFIIKNSFNFSPYLPHKGITFKIIKVLNHYKHQHANKLTSSILYSPPHMPTLLIDKALENFIKTPRLMHTGDIVSIDLLSYGVEKLQSYIYFKVVNMEGPANECYSELEHSLIVSQRTSVYEESSCSYYLPSLEWELIDNKKLSTLCSILPLGFEKYYLCLLKWIQPFLVCPMNGLKPVFIVSGEIGSGKSTVIEAVSKKLGLYYWKVDCNNIISNTLVQINANLKTSLTSAASRSPCILHLRHFEMMSLESDGIDTVQLCESLRTNLEMFSSPYPVIIVATCNDIEQLGREFVRLSLDQMHISLPSENERKFMILWLTRVFSIKLDSNVLEFLISETKSHPFAKIKNIVCLAEKERFLCSDDLLSISHASTVLGRLSSTERLSTSVEWADVGGVELIKKEVVSSLISSRLLSSKNGAISAKRTGLLLYGPPGTGKTLLARAVATQSLRAFIPVNGPDLLNMYVGQSEANVRAVFSRAREASPCIMFFDELDSIAPNRGNKSDSGGVMDRVVSTLLSEMDSLDSSGDVFILGATNRPDLLDPALLRPGRFDKMLYIGPCQDNDSKLKVLKALCRKFLLKDVNLEEIVKTLPAEVTGAMMYAVCSSAWLTAARQLIRDGQVKSEVKVVVQMNHFQQAIKEMTKESFNMVNTSTH